MVAQMNPKLLIVEDDEGIRSQMKWGLAEDYEVFLAEDRASALEAYRANLPLVVLLDLGLPPQPANTTEGLATLSELLTLDPRAKIIITTGQGEKDNALSAIGTGAYDFLCKPVAMPELKFLLQRCVYVAQLEREYRKMQQTLKEETFEGMLGTSNAIQQVFASIRKVATTDAPVLILGESGTGKEMAALAIHRRSARKEGPFVAINCGAIPETLLESELFGHEKGSFTGAHAQRQGRIETANGGTLFLDEIGELPMLLQVKLLRFLQEQRIERIGGRKEIQIDCRVITATNVDLEKAMAAGKFREDLYYRIAVVSIRLPALRERENDIPLLAKAFLESFATANRKKIARLSADAVRVIRQYHWPGNVRELQNRMKRASIMADGLISPEDLELTLSTEKPPLKTLKEAKEQIEKELILEALQRHRGKISPAALDLGISRPTFYE